MGNLYVDFTHSLPTKLVKSHGGGNYTKTILLTLNHYIKENKIRKRLILLWPKDYDATSEIEKRILNSSSFEIRYISVGLDKIEYESDSAIFLPLLGVKEFGIIDKLKKIGLEIYIAVHGLRLLDIKIDKYDCYYISGLKQNIVYFFKDILLLPLRKLAYICMLKKHLPKCDHIITGSNYTLSALSKLVELRDVILQYDGVLQMDNINIELDVHSEKYILFVSGNRTEKNLARSLEAYKEYLKISDEKLPIHIVGVSEQIKYILVKKLKLSSLINMKQIIFYDYVTDEELVMQYKNASFLLYTSKSEGFGLPALEAALRLCPTVAAYGTSIPEVLGECAKYVNPYSIDSIVSGIVFMENKVNNEEYRKMLQLYLPVILSKIENSNNVLCYKLTDI